MEKIKEFIARHPTRSKYILLRGDIFFILFATKMFINYNNIKETIYQTANESIKKEEELAYSKNFQLPYEQSKYADLFLKHENNIIEKKEFIIKFETLKKKEEKKEKEQEEKKQEEDKKKTPQGARKIFFQEKIKKTLKE